MQLERIEKSEPGLWMRTQNMLQGQGFNMYQVIIKNDDVTPMEFVVSILEKVFYMDRWKATQVMLLAHTRGKAFCGLYTKEIAEMKIIEVEEHIKKCDYPLICSMEVG